MPSVFVPTPGDLTTQESPPPGFAIQGKKNASARGSARGKLTDALGNLFKLVRELPSHSKGQSASGDNEKNNMIVIFSSSLSPSGKLPVRM